ncbi:tripartite tricarboxylate transporter TctB family protein [Salsuginibacillus kocurii]|uniref:tripartite tricarboxylate transporter TctB family protein n=1 Tax=Salsuginibacillus kocurii TaxID=427078 RepID=UPI0003670B07|nr:tripartite tricarboxylate transporter TctB family protein [Salsuginibacillus kocurii]
MKNKEQLAALIVLAVAGIFYYFTFNIPAREEDGLGPTFFPRLLLIMIGALAILSLIRSFVTPTKEMKKEEETAEQKKRGKSVWIIFVLFGVFILLVDFLGFTLSAVLFIIAVYLLIGPSQSWKRSARTLGILIVILFVLQFVFQNILEVPLPSGIF